MLPVTPSNNIGSGPPDHQSCKSGGPDVANRQYKSNTADRIYLLLYKAFEQSLHIKFNEKYMKT